MTIAGWRMMTADRKQLFVEHLLCQSPLMNKCFHLIAFQHHRVDITEYIILAEETKVNERMSLTEI